MSANRRPVALSLFCAAVLITGCATVPATAVQSAPAQSPAVQSPAVQSPAAGQASGAAQPGSSAAQQGRLEYGRPAAGRLTDAAPVHDDYPYNDWVFTGTVGERVVIELRSEDFDTFVTVGVMVDGEFIDHAMNDDGFDDGLDSRLVFPVMDSGEYVVRVTSFDAEEYGAYSVLVSRSSVPAVRPLTPGTTVEGRFDLESPSFSDGEYYELYGFEARQGERFTLDLRSDDFDTYLIVGLWRDSEFHDEVDDDDGGEGTNSLIRDWVAPQTGRYVVIVESYDGGEGRYTLRVEGN